MFISLIKNTRAGIATTDEKGLEMKNEHQAHFAMQKSKEQVARDRIADRNARTRLDEQLRKERLNEAMLNKLRQVLTIIAIAIVAYTLFHLA